MKKTKFNQWTQLLYCNELSGNELRVLMLIRNYHNLDNWNSTSLSTLKDDCGVGSTNTISKATKVLEEKGLVTTVMSPYKKNIKPTYDYIPNYERIQEMINAYSKNCVSGISKNDNRGISKNEYKDNISNIIKDSNKTEVTDNPILDNPKTKSIIEVKSNPTMQSKPNEVVSNPRSANLDYIEELERQFNANPSIDSEPTDATHNPSKATTTKPKANDKSKALVLSAHPHINSNYIKALDCITPNKSNPSIMFDLVEASQRPAIFIDAMNKSIEWLQTYLSKGMNQFIAEVYHNANSIINSKDNGLNDKQTKYATDTIKHLKKAIISCGGKEMIVNPHNAA